MQWRDRLRTQLRRLPDWFVEVIPVVVLLPIAIILLAAGAYGLRPIDTRPPAPKGPRAVVTKQDTVATPAGPAVFAVIKVFKRKQRGRYPACHQEVRGPLSVKVSLKGKERTLTLPTWQSYQGRWTTRRVRHLNKHGIDAPNCKIGNFGADIEVYGQRPGQQVELGLGRPPRIHAGWTALTVPGRSWGPPLLRIVIGLALLFLVHEVRQVGRERKG